MGKSRHHTFYLRALVVGGLLGCLVSCAPVKGYTGLERPKEPIALVAVASESINTATADGGALTSPCACATVGIPGGGTTHGLDTGPAYRERRGHEAR